MTAPINVPVGWHSVLDISIKFLAVCIGAWWTLRNYRLDSTHKQRLQAEVKVEFAVRHGREFAVITCQLRNPGRIVVPLSRNQNRDKERESLPGSGLLIGWIRQQDAERVVSNLLPGRKLPERDEDFRWVDVFKAHFTVEPGLTIYEQVLMPKPPNSYDACQATLRIVTPNQTSPIVDFLWVPIHRNEQWTAIAVAVKE